MKTFKPQLLPNNKAGISPNWEERIANPIDWLYSNKLDGARVELFADGSVKGRSLKALPSVHINRMAEDIGLALQLDEHTIIEAEFYSHEMNFSEIMHFFKTEDVTSAHTVSKYQKLWNKTNGEVAKGWKYPGRTVEWLTTWHKSLKFHVFNVVSTLYYSDTFVTRVLEMDRILDMYFNNIGSLEPDMIEIRQNKFEHIDELYQAYDQAIMDDYEGIVVMHRQSTYKCGRHTLNSNQAFKIKNDNLEFDGRIIDVLEGTIAREGAEKSTNELGRSVTSKLQEDRVPSGICKGFLVEMEDGNKLTVSLKDYDHTERRQLLYDKLEWLGLTIRFTGMAPVKDGGCPRHAHFTKGNVRDDK